MLNSTIIKKISLYERKGFITLKHDYCYNGNHIKITDITSNEPDFVFPKKVIQRFSMYSPNDETYIGFDIIGDKKFKSKGTLRIDAIIEICGPKYKWFAYDRKTYKRINDDTLTQKLNENFVENIIIEDDIDSDKDDSDEEYLYDEYNNPIVVCTKKTQKFIFKKELVKYIPTKKFNISELVIYQRNMSNKLYLFEDINSLLTLKINHNLKVIIVANNYEIEYGPINEKCLIDFTDDCIYGCIWRRTFCNNQGLKCDRIHDLYLKIQKNDDDNDDYDLIDVEMKIKFDIE